MKSTESDVCYFEVDAVFNREPVKLLESHSIYAIGQRSIVVSVSVCACVRACVCVSATSRTTTDRNSCRHLRTSSVSYSIYAIGQRSIVVK